VLVVDCHCHAGAGDGFTGPWNTRAPLADYLRRARAAGITRSNLLPAFHSDYAAANRALAGLVRAGAGRFTAFAFVHAARDAGRVFEMAREAIGRFGFCGLKVHRKDARLSREICDVARAFRAPVLYDVVGEVAEIDLYAPEYRDVPFIIPHLGSFADDWRAQTALIDQLQRHPNVFADTSAVRRFDILQQAARRAGAHKLLFGTDGPWLHPALELAKIHALSLTPRERALVLGRNFLRLTARVRRQPGALPAAAPRRRGTRETAAIVPEPAVEAEALC